MSGKDKGASADADRAVVNGAASVSALRASVPSALEQAFLETREFLALLEPLVCDWSCPSKWRTDEGEPHSRLHGELRELLYRHEGVRRDAASIARGIAAEYAAALPHITAQRARIWTEGAVEAAERIAQAIEARRAETGTGSVADESAVREVDAPR